MGTGANVQLRAKAIHHVTCPWRPADLTQRDGRVIRQRNANAEVHSYRYATIGSYDSAAWDGIQRKATMIQQVLRGRLDLREIEDVGDLALNAAQIKAATSGNPLVMEKIEADTARTKLERLKRAYEKSQSSLDWSRGSAEATIGAAEAKLPALKEAIGKITSTAGEDFSAVIDGQRHDKRADVVAAVSEWVRTNTPEYGNYTHQSRNYGTFATLGGHKLQIRNAERDSRLGSYQDLAVTIKDVPAPPTVFTRLELLEGSIGIITRLENKVAGLPEYAAQLENTIADKKAILADVEAQRGKPFKHEERLAAARVVCAELDEKLKASIEPSHRPQKDIQGGVDDSETGLSDQFSAVDVELEQVMEIVGMAFPTPPRAGRTASPPAAQAGNEKVRDTDRNRGRTR